MVELFGIWGAGCRVQGAGCRVQGAGCRVQGGRVMECGMADDDDPDEHHFRHHHRPLRGAPRAKRGHLTRF